MTAFTIHLDDDLLRRLQEMAAERRCTIDDVVADALREAIKLWDAQHAIEEK